MLKILKINQSGGENKKKIKKTGKFPGLPGFEPIQFESENTI